MTRAAITRLRPCFASLLPGEGVDYDRLESAFTMTGHMPAQWGGSMNEFKVSPDHKRLSASELRKLPPDERNAILRAQAALAEEFYRRDRALTDFEAFSEVDLHDDGPIPEEG